MARILIVEDEEGERINFGNALKLRGHVVDLAANADEALDVERNQHHELAIIDFVLPGKRGLDVLRGLRRINPFIRSIIISGKLDHDEMDAEELEKQLQANVDADRYLAKPLSNEKLAEAVEEILKHGPAETVDWKRIASDVVDSRKVKARSVREMDKKLQRSRKKKRP